MISAPYFVLPGPEGFRGLLLDEFLAAGYYRMHHTMFTTHHTRMDTEGENLPVFWLRTRVNDIIESSTAAALRKKCARFTVHYKPAAITAETEALYNQYHSSIDFNSSATVYDCLHDSLLPDPFDSRMIEIRDAGTLVAAGYFDVGRQAISGILNFYHPAYKKYSLGKYMIYEKMLYCKHENFKYFYPGYFVPGYAMFDYKLQIGRPAIEYFDTYTKQWLPLVYEK